jgi:tyrosine--tRNA ligase
LRQLTLNELIETLSSVSVSKVLQRDDFRKRLNAQQGLSMSEMIYPIVMGIDSVELKNREGCDIEL